MRGSVDKLFVSRFCLARIFSLAVLYIFSYHFSDRVSGLVLFVSLIFIILIRLLGFVVVGNNFLPDSPILIDARKLKHELILQACLVNILGHFGTADTLACCIPERERLRKATRYTGATGKRRIRLKSLVVLARLKSGDLVT